MRAQPTTFWERILQPVLSKPARVAVISFACIILVGTFLLCLPVSSESGEWTSPVDALFTSTSAVCVTGLIVKDTPNYWSLFGELVILGLIQAGGLGIMTIYAFLASVLGTGMSLAFERMMGDMVESDPEHNILEMVEFICLFTLVMEVVGAVCLYFSWRGSFDSFWSCFYHSVFHSISAFCNAGFSLNSDSLVRFQANLPVNFTISGLIIMGGIGFLVARDLGQYVWWWAFSRRGRRPQLGTHSRLVLLITGTLLVGGFVMVFLTESIHSMSEAPLANRVLAGLFQSVTPRTAGFNTMPLDAGVIAPSTALLLMTLMFIGGSPGSTAGGIKTTTLGVMISSIIATLRGREDAEMFHHSIRPETVHRVASVILLSIGAVVAGLFLLLVTEKHLQFLPIAFETTSAFGTVGLSMGITDSLTEVGRLIITALMFVGRLGPVTIVLSAASIDARVSYRYPPGHVIVG
jgi:trk system potassium uptake protein TrkH